MKLSKYIRRFGPLALLVLCAIILPRIGGGREAIRGGRTRSLMDHPTERRTQEPRRDEGAGPKGGGRNSIRKPVASHPPDSNFRRRPPSSRYGCGLWLLVRTGDDGAPVKGAVARTVSEEPSFASEPTRLEGRTFLDVPCGEHLIEVEASGLVAFRFRTALSPENVALSRTIDLEWAYRRVGLVRDERGIPLSRAVISVTPIKTTGENPPRRIATGADGRFEIELERGWQRLNVSKPGYQPYSSAIDETRWPEVFTLRREEAEGHLSGVVVNQRGEPVQGASLVLRTETGHSGISARTDLRGRFDLAAPTEGPVQLSVSAEGCLDQRHSLARSGQQSLHLSLHCYPTFIVAVLDKGGTAVDNPAIAGISMATGKPVVNCSGRGRCYSVEYPFQIQASALESGHGITTPVVVPAYTPEIVLRLANSARLEGMVADAQSRPIRSFSVQIQKPLVASAHFYAEDGTFRLDGVPPGEYVLVFAATGYRPVQRIVRVVEGRALKLHLILPLLPAPDTLLPTVERNVRARTSAKS